MNSRTNYTTLLAGDHSRHDSNNASGSSESGSSESSSATGLRQPPRQPLTVIVGAAAMLTGSVLHAATCTNDSIKRILESGTVSVGVKADYKPWGFKDPEGTLVGMEVDMAQAVADTLGVELQTVAVESSNRMQFLQEGKIDVLIATMSDRADRREIVGIVQPNYYTSGTNVLAPKSSGLTTWEELSEAKVCGKQGAFYNRVVAERYGAEVVEFTGNAEAKQALRDGGCAAWVYADSSIMSDLASGEWESYEMPLTSEDATPWALAVALEDRECVLGNMMSGLQYNWLQSGALIELEEKWGIQPTQYLLDQKERFKDWMAQ